MEWSINVQEGWKHEFLHKNGINPSWLNNIFVQSELGGTTVAKCWLNSCSWEQYKQCCASSHLTRSSSKFSSHRLQLASLVVSLPGRETTKTSILWTFFFFLNSYYHLLRSKGWLKHWHWDLFQTQVQHSVYSGMKSHALFQTGIQWGDVTPVKYQKRNTHLSWSC